MTTEADTAQICTSRESIAYCQLLIAHLINEQFAISNNAIPAPAYLTFVAVKALPPAFPWIVVAVHAAGVGRAAAGEGDVGAAQPSVTWVVASVPVTIWKLLSQRQARPAASSTCRRLSPERSRRARCTTSEHSPPDGLCFVGFPVFHREGVRHDASARLQVENLRPQLHVDAAAAGTS